MYRTAVQLIVFIGLSIVSGYIFNRSGLNFYAGIFTGASVQFILNFIYLSALNSYINLKNKALENERIKEFSKQGLEVECPCSKKLKDFVPIVLNTQNKYKCKDCQKIISVYITPSTALTTEPILNTDTTSLNNYKYGNS
ncbi:MAG: hypothetical protein EBU90_06700 [Proteobacteria bacterium]|nr:hypothetical protein [Pseudomonadota bacterium]NBP14997.1 hypothetical protein [bacterium]